MPMTRGTHPVTAATCSDSDPNSGPCPLAAAARPQSATPSHLPKYRWFTNGIYHSHPLACTILENQLGTTWNIVHLCHDASWVLLARRLVASQHCVPSWLLGFCVSNQPPRRPTPSPNRGESFCATVGMRVGTNENEGAISNGC